MNTNAILINGQCETAPDDLEAYAGQTVTITNTGQEPIDLTIRPTPFNEGDTFTIAAGRSVDLTVADEAAEEGRSYDYVVSCNPNRVRPPRIIVPRRP